MRPSGNTRRGPFPLVRVLPGTNDYPASLSSCGIEVPLHLIGEPGLLRLPAMALFCSVKCPGSVVTKTYEAMQRLKLQDRVITGGFHSPMERTCLDILMRGRVKLILCPARGIRRLRIRPEWRALISDNRLLVISPFNDQVRRSTIHLACARNRLVAAMAESLLIPFAARKSRTEQFAVEMISNGKTVYTVSDPESRGLIDLGARPFPL
jgi:predicted Rossmann fold nucleotide-binding protein DprA/Smf involved in DNA uptake